MERNAWPESNVTDGRDGAELVAEIERNMHMLTKMFSVGQTGADRAALVTFIELSGWIPKNQKTEDGILP